MDGIDFSGLVAKAVAGLDEVRACLLVSRDGLTLGAYPQGGEERAREAWSRLGAVGDPERGFLVMSDEVWVFARRGPYACIVVGTASAKAGLLLDRMEATLRAAEEARQQAGTAPPPSAVRRPRIPLHRESRPEPAAEAAEPVLEQVARVLRVPDEEQASSPQASMAPPAPPPVREEPRLPEPPLPVAPPPVAEPPAAPTPPVEVPPVEPTPPVVQPVEYSPAPPPPAVEEPAVEEPPGEALPVEELTVEEPPVEADPAPQLPHAEIPPVMEPPRREEPVFPAAEVAPPAAPMRPETEMPKYAPPSDLLGEAALAGGAPSATPIEEQPAAHEPVPPNRSDDERGSEDAEVDPVALAREFAQLFDEPDSGGEL